MRKYMYVLLAAVLFVGCFVVTAKASEATMYATGKFTVNAIKSLQSNFAFILFFKLQ